MLEESIFFVNNAGDNMALDPQAAKVLENIEKVNLPPLETLTPPDARRQYEQAGRAAAGKLPDVFDVCEYEANGPFGVIPLRVYIPREPAGQALPVLIYFHGGGYVVGSRDSHDAPCRHLALAGDCIVVSVDYHMAPEHPFPEPVQDCWAAVNWITDNIEKLGGRADLLAVAGDSAGGNLATVMCLMARDHGGPRFVHQLLIYPGTDKTGSFPSR
jgi:acetyl esterase